MNPKNALKDPIIQALMVQSVLFKCGSPSVQYMSVHLHPPTVTVYITVPPPGPLLATGFLISFSHASYSSLCRMIPFSFDLDSGKRS